MSEVAQQQVAGAPVAGGFYSAAPTVTITAPSGTTEADTVTVTWTYSSPLSKPQFSYLVEFLNEAGTSVLFTSGVVQSTATTYASPFLLSAGSRYMIRVTVSDATESASASTMVWSLGQGVANFPLEPKVGTVYEVAINGQGYMLADTPERPYRRQAATLQAPRLATGDTPFSEAIERYSFVGAGDWSSGAGQEVAGRERSAPAAYFDSEGVDPFTPGELSLLNTTAVEIASTSSPAQAAVASDRLFVRTGTGELRYQSSIGGTPTTVTFTGRTITDLTSDGTRWYVSTDLGRIYRGTDATVGSAWADLVAETSDIRAVEWCVDRIVAVYVNGSGQWCVSPLGDNGAEEEVGGRFKYSDATVKGLAAGDGFLWFGVNRTDRSVVRAWNLTGGSGAFQALTLPPGETIEDLFFYLGNVMIRTSNAGTVAIYRCVPSQGRLTPEIVTSFTGAAAGRFGGKGRFVFWSWAGMQADGRSGIGCLDLSSGGWCKHLSAPSAGNTAAVSSVYLWKGRVGFSIAGVGACLETSTVRSSGFLTSSIADLNSSLLKVVDSVSVTTDPLPANGSVQVQVSTDVGVSHVPYGTVSTPGGRGGEFTIGGASIAFSYRLVLSANGTSPVVRMVQVKLHPLSVADAIVELPIDLAVDRRGLNGASLPERQPVMGKLRGLENLVGTRVRFQDVDWPEAKTSEVWEVAGVQFSSVGVYDRLKQRRVEQSPVAVVTLRRGV
jgi:hypothetical protein